MVGRAGYRLKLEADYVKPIPYRAGRMLTKFELKKGRYEIRLFFGIYDTDLIITAAIFADVAGKQPWMNVALFNHIFKHGWERLPPNTATRAEWQDVWSRQRRLLHEAVNSTVHGLVSSCKWHEKTLNPEYTFYPLPLDGIFLFFSLFFYLYLFLFNFYFSLYCLGSISILQIVSHHQAATYADNGISFNGPLLQTPEWLPP